MRNSKHLALAFLLGAFLTGGVLGFTANGYLNRERVWPEGRGRASLVARLSARLDLSAAQQHAVDSLLDDRSRQYRAAMATIRPRMDSIKLAARDQIRRVLSEEQKRAFDALIAEMTDSTRRTSAR